MDWDEYERQNNYKTPLIIAAGLIGLLTTVLTLIFSTAWGIKGDIMPLLRMSPFLLAGFYGSHCLWKKANSA